MTMPYIDKSSYIEAMKKQLKPSRLSHTMRVVDMADVLAQRHFVDRDSTFIAAILHDSMKCISPMESKSLCKKYNMDMERYGNNHNLAHGKLAEIYARENFNITDQDILNAISYHTTGRAGMTMLEKVVFVADAVEIGRRYEGVEKLRELALVDIDKAVITILEFTIKSLKEKGLTPDLDTVEGYNYLKGRSK